MIWMDQRGSGDAQNAKDYSMDRILNDMDEVRARLNIDQMYLMCHSFGGVIQINYAKKYPQHVRGLIFVSSTLHFFGPDVLKEQIEYGYSLIGKDTILPNVSREDLLVGDMLVRKEMSKKRVAYKFLTDSIQTIVELDKMDSLHPRTNDFGYAVVGPILDSTRKMLYPVYFDDYTPLTATIKAPTLVITGTNDHATGLNHYQLFNFPNQTTVRVEGGHLLYHEQTDQFVKAVSDFVKNP